MEMEEIVVTGDKDLTWQDFDDDKRETCDIDKHDEDIYYTDRASKMEGMKLRTLTCLINKCTSKQHFPNVDSLRRHMENTHQKTFCLVCLKGRTVFIRE